MYAYICTVRNKNLYHRIYKIVAIVSNGVLMLKQTKICGGVLDVGANPTIPEHLHKRPEERFYFGSGTANVWRSIHYDYPLLMTTKLYGRLDGFVSSDEAECAVSWRAVLAFRKEDSDRHQRTVRIFFEETVGRKTDREEKFGGLMETWFVYDGSSKIASGYALRTRVDVGP